MEVFMGFVLCLVVELFLYGAYRMHRRNTTLPARPQPPRTAAQLANEQVFDELQRNTPRMFSVKYQRRTRRGPARRLEREDNYLEE